MKRKYYLIHTVAVLMTGLLTGCGNESYDNTSAQEAFEDNGAAAFGGSSEPEVTDATELWAEQSDWKQAYLAEAEEIATEKGLEYDLIYLDADDIPELVAAHTNGGFHLYTLKNGEVCELMDCTGLAGVYRYAPYQGIIGKENNATGQMIYFEVTEATESTEKEPSDSSDTEENWLVITGRYDLDDFRSFLGITDNISEKEECETENNYEAEYNYEVYTTQYTLSSGYTMNIFQVRDMTDKVLEDKVNESLNSYLYILVEPWFLPERLEEYEPVIHCQTERYLSVEYSFRYTTATDTVWHYCITVDIQKGEVVFLDDIIDISQAFAERIKNGSIIKRAVREGWWYTEEEVIEGRNKWYSERKTDYIQRVFNSFTREYLYGDYYREIGYDMSTYVLDVYENTFYLEEGKICFTAPSTSSYKIEWITLEDIEDFLKVPKW